MGSHVECKAEKVKGTIVSMEADSVKLEVADANGVIATVPTKSFLQGSRSSYVPKPDPTEVNFSLPSGCESLKLQHVCSKIFQKVCELSFQHEAATQSLKFTIKPQKKVIALKKFEKNKLCLIPVCQRVSYKVGDHVPANLAAVRVADFPNVGFWLVPMGNSVKEDNFMSPFWHLSHSHEGHNMELFNVKFDNFRIPVARNLKVIEAGDVLVLFKEKATPENSVEISSASSGSKRLGDAQSGGAKKGRKP